jgi:hypothetical protein
MAHPSEEEKALAKFLRARADELDPPPVRKVMSRLDQMMVLIKAKPFTDMEVIKAVSAIVERDKSFYVVLYNRFSQKLVDAQIRWQLKATSSN